MDKTGKTQGIKFKSNPPTTASKMAVKRVAGFRPTKSPSESEIVGLIEARIKYVRNTSLVVLAIANMI